MGSHRKESTMPCLCSHDRWTNNIDIYNVIRFNGDIVPADLK